MMLLRLLALSLSLILAEAYPSRLKILPGLAFYRTDDGHDDTDSALMDKDRDLLKSMWNIVDKIDNKVPGQNTLSMFQNSHIDNTNEDEQEQTGRSAHPQHVYRSVYPTQNQASNVPALAPSNSQVNPATHAVNPGTKIHPVGTPITTINVYSTYPATSVKGEHYPPAPYPPVPAYRPAAGYAGAVSVPASGNGLTAPAFEPAFEPRKVLTPYEFVQNNPDFEAAPPLPVNQDQFGSQEGRLERQDSQRYEGLSQDNGYGPSDQGSDPDRMQYLFQQRLSEMRPMGDMMQNYRNMPESHMNRY